MSRYYDPVTHRFLNADGYFQSGNDLLDANMNTYCRNNPVINVDPRGTCWVSVYSPCGGAQIGQQWMVMGPVPGVPYYCYKCGKCDPSYNPSYSPPQKDSNVVISSSLPYRGEPNSKDTLYNPDGSIKQERWYGPDRLPQRDRDYNHPGDMPFPHDHVWKDGKRGKEHLEPSPEYKFSWDQDIYNKNWSFNFNFNPPMGDKPIWEKAWEDLKRIFS